MSNEITAERKANFEKEFRELLKKHKVELILSDDGREYGMHSPVLEFVFDSVFDDYNDVTYEDFDVNLNELDLV